MTHPAAPSTKKGFTFKSESLLQFGLMPEEN